MSKLSPEQIAAVAFSAGFRGVALTRAVAVALAESGGDPKAVGVNTDKYKSRDRGLWQINDHWHKEVTDAQAFQPSAAALHTYRISKQGTDWSPWATWPGAAAVHMARAQLATAKYRGKNEPIASGIGDKSGNTDPEAIAKGVVKDSVSNATDALGTAANHAGDAVSAVVDPMADLIGGAVGLVRWLSDPHSWARVALVVGGSAGVLLAAKMLADSGKLGDTAQSASRTATKAAKIITKTK